MAAPKWLDDLIEATCQWFSDITGIPVPALRSDTDNALEHWSDIGEQLLEIITTTPFDRAEFDRVIAEHERKSLQWANKIHDHVGGDW